MKVKYTGIKNVRKKTKGCGVCGRRYSTGGGLTTYEYTHKATLPSGKTITFRLNQIYDIHDQNDYQFLIDFSYIANGKKEHPFVPVTSR